MSKLLPKPTLDEFLKLSNSTAKLVEVTPNTASELASPVSEQCRERIRQVLSLKEGGWSVEAVFRLSKIVETAVHLGVASTAQWQLIWEVVQALRTAERCHPISDAAAWHEALEAACTAVNGSTHRHTINVLTRESLLANALHALSRKGFPTALDGFGGRLTEKGYVNACALIEKKVRNLGGARVANAVFDAMQRKDRIYDGSLLHARTPSMILKSREASIPWHFIYSLALKHLDDVPRNANPVPVFAAIEELSRNMAASLDVEPHSSYENLSVSGEALIEFLRDTVIYDGLFAFPQWQPLAANFLVPAWIKCLKGQTCDPPSHTWEHWR